MVHNRINRKDGLTRFSVTLPTADHDRLEALGAAANPPLKLNYMVQLAVAKYLEHIQKEDTVTIEVGVSGGKT